MLLGADAERIEWLWQRMWWALHYGGRGGLAALAISAVDIALWDMKARRCATPLWRLLGGHDPRVPCYAGGIDLDLPLDALLRQTDDNLARGFRAIKMKVGRPRAARGRGACAGDARAPRRRFPADGRRQHALERGRGDSRGPRAGAASSSSGSRSRPSPTTWPATRASRARAACPSPTGENLHTLYEFSQMIRAGGVSYPEPDVTNCGGVTVFMKVAHLAEAFNLPVTSHGAHDLTVHLLAAAPNRSYLEAHGFGLDRYIADPMRDRRGLRRRPRAAGPRHSLRLGRARRGAGHLTRATGLRRARFVAGFARRWRHRRRLPATPRGRYWG